MKPVPFTAVAESPSSDKPVILVVEDDDLLRICASDLLEDNGYAVVEAANAEAALEVLRTRSDVRVLFTDIQMPGPMDGMDLTREVHRRWPNVLLVVTSGRLRPKQEEIPDDGRFISKPYAEAELVGQVESLLNKT
jgi:two-component system, response regulator PdtaR